MNKDQAIATLAFLNLPADTLSAALDRLFAQASGDTVAGIDWHEHSEEKVVVIWLLDGQSVCPSETINRV